MNGLRYGYDALSEIMFDLPQALANVLSAMEDAQLRYVLYRDPKADARLVIIVEGPTDRTAFENALRGAGAEPPSGRETGYDFIFRSPESADGSGSPYKIQLKAHPGSGKTSIANLLWLAATEEGAAAAGDAVQRGK